MKTLILVSLLLLPTAAFAQPKIESKYDRFTDKTTVRVRFLKVFQAHMRTIMLTGSYQYKGQSERIEPPDVVWLDFYSTGDDRIDHRTKLYVLFDSKRAEYKAEVRDGIYALAFDQFEHIINSKKLEMRLGDVELALSDETIKALRDFIPKPAKK